QDHFEGDETVEALLPRPVDDAHPAPAHFFEDLIVAEGAGRRVGAVGRWRRPERGRGGGEAILAGEELRQLGGELGVGREERGAVGPLAALDGFDVAQQRLVQAQFPRPWLRGQRHESPPSTSPSSRRSFLMPRTSSPTTAALLLPSRRPTSSTVQP